MLENSENMKTADFWEGQVKTSPSPPLLLVALEAYYHSFKADSIRFFQSYTILKMSPTSP